VEVDAQGRIELSPDSTVGVTGPVTALGTDLIPRALGPFAATPTPAPVAGSQTLALSALFYADLNNTDAVTVRIDGNNAAALFPGMSKGFSFGLEATMDMQDFSLVAASGTQNVNVTYFYPV
tara:strand:- start:14381 stop:14746 length:366 start_codon:yes stop_codon:yes gene_type:complete